MPSLKHLTRRPSTRSSGPRGLSVWSTLSTNTECCYAECRHVLFRVSLGLVSLCRVLWRPFFTPGQIVRSFSKSFVNVVTDSQSFNPYLSFFPSRNSFKYWLNSKNQNRLFYFQLNFYKIILMSPAGHLKNSQEGRGREERGGRVYQGNVVTSTRPKT
jgi:hypothetical protein